MLHLLLNSQVYKDEQTHAYLHNAKAIYQTSSDVTPELMINSELKVDAPKREIVTSLCIYNIGSSIFKKEKHFKWTPFHFHCFEPEAVGQRIKNGDWPLPVSKSVSAIKSATGMVITAGNFSFYLQKVAGVVFRIKIEVSEESVKVKSKSFCYKRDF